MLIISHRANLHGPGSSVENSLEAIKEAIQHGFSVEVDLRMKDNEIYFGHDEPEYKVDLDFLEEYKRYLWIHCKDLNALEYALSKALHCFWHTRDDYTLTNYRYVWAYPGKEPIGKLSVICLPEWHWKPEEVISKNPFGVCTDYPFEYQDIINRK